MPKGWTPTEKLNVNQQYPYQSITIHPPDENGAREVWAEYEEIHGGKTFDSDGIIGWLYSMGNPNPWIWMNEAGHPCTIFPYTDDLRVWLSTRAPTVTWAEEART